MQNTSHCFNHRAKDRMDVRLSHFFEYQSIPILLLLLLPLIIIIWINFQSSLMIIIHGGIVSRTHGPLHEVEGQVDPHGVLAFNQCLLCCCYLDQNWQGRRLPFSHVCSSPFFFLILLLSPFLLPSPLCYSLY